MKVSFKLTNTGKVDGSEAPQVYIASPEIVPEGVQFSPKLLGGFTRVDLQVGESKIITIEVDKQRFCYWDVKTDNWVIPPGGRDILVGSSSRDIRLTGKTNF